MKRLILNTLEDWKKEKSHKILLIRGARQVGKTYIVRELAREFKYFVEINFEKNSDIHHFFEQNLDPERICSNLSAYLGIPIIEGETLVFFDEIQACPKAIQSLRFFYEAKQGLHLIATGSLLEFSLTNLSSWGVGRIRSAYMYPMSFDEFLMANNQEALVQLKKDASPTRPLNQGFHEQLKALLRIFLLIGGMPEAVKSFIENKSDINAVKNVLTDIRTSYFVDFSKYRRQIPVLRLQEVMNSVVRLSGGKYIFSQSGSLSNPRQAKEALELLEMAGLVYKVYHSSGQGLPLGSEANFKKFKCLLLDNGIFQQIAGLELNNILIADNIDILNKGHIAETFAGIEMMKYSDAYHKRQLYYWHREKRGSSAEVDYLIGKDGQVVPIEIKSGSTGKMQSLNLFLKEKKSSQGIRVSLENFSQYGKITVVPLYAISTLIQ